MLAFVGRALLGAVKLGVKYVVVPMLVSVAVAIVADEVAGRMRRRTASLDADLAAQVREETPSKPSRRPKAVQAA